MDGLVLADDNILAGLPLETPLSRDYIIGVNLLIAKHFHSASRYAYPSRRPAESFVFCVEEACILEAKKKREVVSWLKARLCEILWVNIFINIIYGRVDSAWRRKCVWLSCE